MRYDAFYIIRGSRDLHARVCDSGVKDLDYVMGPFLWSNPQGGRSAYSEADHLACVKRLFLAHLTHLLLPAGILEKLFSDFRLDVSFFDEWWNIEVFLGIDQAAPKVVEQLRAAGFTEALASVGAPLVRAERET